MGELQFTIEHPLHAVHSRLDWQVVDEGDGVPVYPVAHVTVRVDPREEEPEEKL